MVRLRILFWDIDGTLIKTGKAGLFAFEQALQEIWHTSVDFDQVKTSGMTDYHIAAQLIELAAGRPAEKQEAERLVGRYEELLAGHLAMREGLILPSVAAILQALKGSADYRSFLLTGNSRIGAELKLRKFDLHHHFDFESSAFCQGNYTRDEVAACARQTVEALGSHLAQVFVIGDTPNDIRCGKAIGAYTIGVATGTYTVEQLAACAPSWAVEKLPSPREFIAKLDEISSAG